MKLEHKSDKDMKSLTHKLSSLIEGSDLNQEAWVEYILNQYFSKTLKSHLVEGGFSIKPLMSSTPNALYVFRIVLSLHIPKDSDITPVFEFFRSFESDLTKFKRNPYGMSMLDQLAISTSNHGLYIETRLSTRPKRS